MRHGETALNASQRLQGHSDAALNDLGRRQASALAQALATKQVDAVYSSPLRRAFDTASAIGDALRLPVETLPGLRELDIGVLDGLSGKDLRERFPDFARQWAECPDIARTPGGETMSELQHRAWEAVTLIHSRHVDASVAVVSHSFTILSLMTRFLGMPLANFKRWHVDLASITTVEWQSDYAKLLGFNHRGHLDGLTEERR